MGSSRNLEPFTGRTGRRLRLATFALLLATAALAAEPGRATPEPWTVNFYLENDLFVNTDNDYTNGLRLSFISPDLDNYLDDPTLPQWVREINRQLAFMHGSLHGVDRNLVLAIGQAIYTPADPVPAPMPAGSMAWSAIRPRSATGSIHWNCTSASSAPHRRPRRRRI